MVQTVQYTVLQGIVLGPLLFNHVESCNTRVNYNNFQINFTTPWMITPIGTLITIAIYIIIQTKGWKPKHCKGYSIKKQIRPFYICRSKHVKANKLNLISSLTKLT